MSSRKSQKLNEAEGLNLEKNKSSKSLNPNPDHIDYSELYNKAKLYSPISKLEEKWKLVPAFLQVRGLVKQHIDSFNYFTDIEIKNIIRSTRNFEIKSEINPHFYLHYHDIHIGFPSIEEDLGKTFVTPHECRLRSLTYCAPIFVDISYTMDGETEKIIKDICIGKIPIMLGSNHCHLKGKNYKELSAMKECPYDPRGYFIINGVEKIILIHEQMSVNRIIVEYDNKGKNLSANVTSFSQDTKSRTSVIYKNNIFYVKLKNIKNNINLMIIFKALNILSDQEVIMLIGHKNKAFLNETIYDCYNSNVITREDALNYLASISQIYYRDNDFQAIIEKINDVLIANVPVIRGNYYPKALFLALMTKKLIDAIKDRSKVDDKDYYGNKRLELAGNLIALLFEDLFKKFNSDLKKQIDQSFIKEGNKTLDISLLKTSNIITHGLIETIATGNWVIKRFNMTRGGVTELLSRMSYISALGLMVRINSQFEKTRKIGGPRALQPSQWGMICPSDTPESISCGLVKSLALLAHVTTAQNEKSIINLCINLGAEEITINPEVDEDEIDDELNLVKNGSGFSKKLENKLNQNFIIFVNGKPIGLTSIPNEFCNKFRKCRRKGLIHEFVSIFYNKENNSINIACDSGRLTRPYIRVEKGKSLITSNDLKMIQNKSITFSSLVKCGKIEYLDVNEENNALIALDEKWIKPETTHMEIAQYSIFGVVAGLIPYPHHNQSPRITYQCGMGKQAIGNIGYNQLIRTDTVLYLMIYSQKPLVKTLSIELINYEKLPAGQNASVAVMSYSGYDIEDAIILNKASLERGFGRIMALRRFDTTMETYPNGKKDVKLSAEKDPSYKNSKIPKNLQAIDKDGLPFVGAKLTNGDIYVNKFIPPNISEILPSANEMEYKKTPLIYRISTPSYVDRVILTSNLKSPELIKIILRQTRTPELGDKFSSRHGQKGVCGMIVPQEDMPFNEQGWCPDLIMNPHGYPSRMTVGKLIELIGSKSAALDGKLKYGTAFAGDSPEDLGNILIANGFSYSGKDILYSGLTGEPLNCFVFNGPIFYQRLKHMVLDKIHSRSRGPKTLLTRQPMEGRSKEGGLRLGEMERDCLIGFGASCLLLERLMISSDLFLASICGKCGYLGMKGYCQYCGDGSNMIDINLPYAFKLLTQELMSMNIKVKFKIANI